MIKSGIIANTEGGKAACTLEYVENNSENDRLTAILDNKDVRQSITSKQMTDLLFYRYTVADPGDPGAVPCTCKNVANIGHKNFMFLAPTPTEFLDPLLTTGIKPVRVLTHRGRNETVPIKIIKGIGETETDQWYLVRENKINIPRCIALLIDAWTKPQKFIGGSKWWY